MVRRIASLGFLCVVLSSVACGPGEKVEGGSGGSGGSQVGPGGSGGSKPPCENTKKDNDETGVDCGGPDCKACPEGQGCKELSDCKNGLECIAEICQALPTCGDGKQNQDETDIDCGGVCTTQTPPHLCGPLAKCLLQADCQSNSCTGGICTPASCTDAQVNNAESDVDCGGVQSPKCARCEANEKCTSDTDCISKNCKNLRCAEATCIDEVQNGEESDLNCGGNTCPGCDVGKTCTVAHDCASGICGEDKLCAEPSCSDMIHNQDEADADCGGICNACNEPDGSNCVGCPTGTSCSSGIDCQSGVCSRFTFLCVDPTCTDGVKNGAETDKDCGGGGCGFCTTDQHCRKSEDCDSHNCPGSGSSKTCAASTCVDQIQNQGESDIDCGGINSCPRCGTNKPCVLNSDCESQVCAALICKAPTCTDNKHNGKETDLDCGGPECKPCGSGRDCDKNSDCDHDLCVDGACKNPQCGDNKIEGDETCEDLNLIDTDTCSNSCKRPRCGDAIVQQLGSWKDGNGDPVFHRLTTIDDPVVVSPFNNAGHVCGKGGSCEQDSCDVVDTETAPEHGICQALGYGSAVSVVWGNGEGDSDFVMPHAANWACKFTKKGADVIGYTCIGGADNNAKDDCAAADMLGSITCVGEQCDKGAANDDAKADACRTDCRMAWCGDSVQDTGELCDNGKLNSDELPNACRRNCQKAHCGDHVVDLGEECDDANIDDTDACYSSCKKNPDFGG